MSGKINRIIAACVLAGFSAVSFAQQSIMATGDSITSGWNRPGYRLPLLDDLASMGCNIDMVGDQVHNTFNYRDPRTSPGSFFPGFSPALGYDTDHQSFPGIRTEHLLNGTSSAFYTISPIATYVTAHQPDYVLLHIGTNDLNLAIATGTDTAAEINTWANQTQREVESTLDRIIASHSNPANLRILLANFIPYKGPFANTSQINTARQASAVFTTKLEQLVAAKGDSRVLLVDVATGFNVDTMTTDGVHPNRVGEQHMAGAFLPVLLGAGLCSNSVPAITSPSNGSTVSGQQMTLAWNDGGLSVDRWRVYVGDTQSGNSSTYFDSGVLGASARSMRVPNLPMDDSNVFVSLNYRTGGLWNQIMTRFISESDDNQGGGSAPAITSPAAGSELPGSTVTLNWDDNGTRAVQWYFRIGRTPSGEEYGRRRITNAAQRSAVFSGLPTDGSRVYVEFSHRLSSGTWISENLEYRAATTSGDDDPVDDDDPIDDPVDDDDGNEPAITSPSPGSTLPGATTTFNWANNGTRVVQWYFRIGSSPAGQQYAARRITNGSQLSTSFSGLPTDGSRVYVEFSHKLASGTWVSQNFQYQAASSSDDPTDQTNNPPIALDDRVGPITIGGSLTFSVTGNDTDNDGSIAPRTVTITSRPQVGSAAVLSSGQIRYTHNGTPGTVQDVLSYTVKDDDGAVSNAATVTIRPFQPVDSNPGPVAVNDVAGPMNVGESLTFPVLFNDTHSSGTIDVSSVVITRQPGFGRATALANGLITYVHTGSVAGSDSLTYTVKDTAGNVSNTATATISPIRAAGSLPTLTNPAPGSRLPGANVTFNWTANSTAVRQWYLRVGRSVGSGEFLDTRITNAATRRFTVNGLPTDGRSTVHVEFSYLQGNTWIIRNFEFLAASGGT